MKTIMTYLTVAGNCREAMEYYRGCLGGEITQMQTFQEGHMQVDKKLKGLILHAELKTGDATIMASDGMAEFVYNPGNYLSLTLILDDQAEEERIFAALASGGKVTMPLQDTFWAPITACSPTAMASSGCSTA
jgi:PhnB protein